MVYHIREIAPRDDGAIARIIRQVLTEFGANGEGFAWADPELDHLSTAYQGRGSVYYVATVADRVVGGVGIAPFPCEYPNLCELQKMYLLPEVRGQGIGRALMDQALAAIARCGYDGCYLETFGPMATAIRLYERSGFEPLPHPIGQSPHHACDRYYLRWLTPTPPADPQGATSPPMFTP
jgi:putative acetyltransferase